MHIPKHHSIKELKILAKNPKNHPIRERLLAVIFGIQKMSAREISERLQRDPRWVQKWIYQYRDHGINGLYPKKHTGRPPFLTVEQREILSKRIQQGPTLKDGVSLFGAEEIRKIVKNEFGVTYTKGSIYGFLHRLGYSWLCPRPVHEKNDPVKMAEWKNLTAEKISKLRKEKGKKK